MNNTPDAYSEYKWNKSQTSEILRARRLFWEACASRAPLVLGRTEGPPWTHREGSKEVAGWADRMLEEWDRRWISKEEEEEEDPLCWDKLKERLSKGVQKERD